jgi:hypothetical protein
MQFMRPGFDPLICSFTEADAKAAGLIRPNSGYTKYPADMYFARCGVKGCRRIAPDATCNLYSIEELSEGQYTTVDEVPAGGVVEVEGFSNQPQSRPSQSASKEQPKGKPASAPADGKGFRMPFGKHKGDLIAEVPKPYLQWCLGSMENLHDGTRKIIEDELNKPAEPETKADPTREGLLKEIPELEREYAAKNDSFKPLEARDKFFKTRDLNEAGDNYLVGYWNLLTEKIRGVAKIETESP